MEAFRGLLARAPDAEKKIRIAVVVPAFDNAGGVSAVADFLLRTLSRDRRWTTEVISLATSRSDPYSVLLTKPWTWFHGARVRKACARGTDFVGVGAHFVEFEFQRFRPREALSRLLSDCDLIQVVAGTPAWAYPVLGLRAPVVLQVATLASVERRMRGRLGSGFLKHWRRLMTGVTTQYDRAVLKRVDAVVVENQWMFDHASALAGDHAMVRFAPPGVDTETFSPLACRDPARGYILIVGRLAAPRKNIGLLLEAYASLHACMAEPPPLVLAGATAPPPQFWNRADALGLSQKIRFVQEPSRAALAALYRGAQSFVLVSDEEGFGVVLIEAIASGVPVVSTRSGGPDGIITDGKDGFLVDRDDSGALSERLHVLAADPELNLRMGCVARTTVVERFSEKVAGDAFLSLYDTLLAGKRSNAVRDVKR